MIKAVLFDFDGTLADTLPEIREGVNMTMRKLGYPEHDLAAVRSFINHGVRNLVRSALPKPLQEDVGALNAALEVFHPCYEQTCLQTKETYSGMKELVQRLHCDYKIGVLSNKPDAFLQPLCRQVLEEGSYDAVQGGLSDHPTKPDPYLAKKIADALGVDTSECVMIGDSDVDFLTAENANMEHIGVSWGFRDEEFLRQHGINRIAHTVEELEMMIHRLFDCRK